MLSNAEYYTHLASSAPHPVCPDRDLFLVLHLISHRHNGAGDKQIRINMFG